MLKILVCLFSIWIFFLGWSYNPSEVFASKITTITIDVEKDKANETGWDLKITPFDNKAPDIAICISHSLVGTLCLPEGDNIKNIKTPQCQNSYHCRFSVETPDRNFKISVVDVDLVYNDLIGTGHCRQGKTCMVGGATIQVK